MAISHTDNLELTYTNDTGYDAIVTLYRYEIGNLYELVETSDTLLNTETVVFTLTNDNLYLLNVAYTNVSDYIIKYDYLVTDNIETYLTTLLEKVICSCDGVDKDIQKKYYKYNKMLMLIGSFITSVFGSFGSSTTSTNILEQFSSIDLFNTKIEEMYTNCFEFIECKDNTCNC